MTMPQTYYVTQKEILSAGIGITRHDLRKATNSGCLKRVTLPGGKYGKYVRDEVMKVFAIKESA